MNRTVEDGGRALVAEPFEERWADTKIMGAEVKKYIPVLLSVEDPLPIQVDGGDEVVHRLFAKDGTTYLLLVNTTREAARAKVTCGVPARMVGAEIGVAPPTATGPLDLAFTPLDIKLLTFRRP